MIFVSLVTFRFLGMITFPLVSFKDPNSPQNGPDSKLIYVSIKLHENYGNLR
jgi:hypothetical protein